MNDVLSVKKKKKKQYFQTYYPNLATSGVIIMLSQHMYPKGPFNPLWKIGLISLRILRNSGGKNVNK